MSRIYGGCCPSIGISARVRLRNARNTPVRAIDPDGNREALAYGKWINVEPGFVVLLADRNAHTDLKHTVMIAGFTGSGRNTHALIAEHAPQEHNKGADRRETLIDSKPHPIQIVDSNSPQAGAGVRSLNQVTPVKVSENRTLSGAYHSDLAVSSAVAAINTEGGLQYNNTQTGSLGQVTDCAGAVDQLLGLISGTLTSQVMPEGYNMGEYFRVVEGNTVDGTAPPPP